MTGRTGAHIRALMRSRWPELLVAFGGLAMVVSQVVVAYRGSWDIYRQQVVMWRHQAVVLQHLRALHPGVRLPTVGRPQPPAFHLTELLQSGLASGLRWSAFALLVLLLVRAGHRLVAVLVAGALFASAVPPLATSDLGLSSWGSNWWLLLPSRSGEWGLLLAEVAAAVLPAVILLGATRNNWPRPRIKLISLARRLVIPGAAILGFAALTHVAQLQGSIEVSGSFPFPTSFSDPLGTPAGFAVIGLAYLVAGGALASRSPNYRWLLLAITLPPLASPYAFTAVAAGPGWQVGQSLKDLATPAVIAALGAVAVRVGPAVGALWVRAFRRTPRTQAA